MDTLVSQDGPPQMSVNDVAEVLHQFGEDVDRDEVGAFFF